jgi:solute carrier family 25 protein 38
MKTTDTETSHEQRRKMIESYVNSPMVKSFLAGSLSGTCSTILFQPLDLVKTRLQSPLALGQTTPSGMVTVVTNVVRNEKFLGLWKGLFPSLSRTVPGIGVYFSSLHHLRSTFGSPDPSPVETMVMGACARGISGVTMLPFTVVKTRFESGQFQYTGVGQALVSIYKVEGLKGLFSGLSATLLRDAPFSGLYLMFYTQTKKFVRASSFCDEKVGLTPMHHFCSGLVAGFAASVVTQPADVVKTHMQLYPHKFSKFTTVIIYVFKKEGAVGFLRGVIPRTMRRTMMAALAWTVYEQVMASVGLK